MAVTTLRQIRQMPHTKIDDLKKKVYAKILFEKYII
jgi:hypothetical protein